MLALQQLVSAPMIDRAMLRGSHEPGARVVRDARLRPLLERGNESVLCEFLGKTDIAHNPRETGDDPGGLDPPDRVNCSMCIGSRHCYQSHHLWFAGATPSRPRLIHSQRSALWRCYPLRAKSS